MTRSERDLLRQKINEARREEQGVTAADYEWWHGTEYGYQSKNHRGKQCRCPECTSMASYKRSIRRKKQIEREGENFHKKDRERRRIYKESLTPEQTEKRLEKKREYDINRKKNMSPVEKAVFKKWTSEYHREYMKRRWKSMTKEQRDKRNEAERERRRLNREKRRKYLES